MDIAAEFLSAIRNAFEANKRLADRAVAQAPDDKLHIALDASTNSIAVIMRHVAGNLLSRWTDFLTTDGEKPSRDRDGEFVLTPADTRGSLTAAWERGWQVLFDTLSGLTDADLGKTVLIRGEPHRVQQAILRGLDHAAYHVGQILYLARLLNPGGEWLTVPPGASRTHRPAGGYLKPA